MPKLKNYEDSKCSWGYMTLCTECVEYVRTKPFGMRHVNADKEVHGFPVGDHCENCGRKDA